jgi:REP element-mobilizing transposase RayT
MPRLTRQWVPEGYYHVTLRGNNRQRIFLDDLDSQHYLLTLRRHRDEVPFRLLAYALMPNHAHLVIKTSPKASFSTAMQRISAGYTRYFNERHGRVGHLYQGRFYSNLVAQESYLLEVTRYVHLNPVRAGLCRAPADYTWSSYPMYVADRVDPLGLTEPRPILRLFGATEDEQRQQYRQFVEELAKHEQRVAQWVRRLTRDKLIPPEHWLNPKVSDT